MNDTSRLMVCVSGTLTALSCVVVYLLAEYQPGCLICVAVFSLAVPLGITVLLLSLERPRRRGQAIPGLDGRDQGERRDCR